MTARLDLVCHAATSATHAHAFPADEPLDRRRLLTLRAADWRLQNAGRSWTSPALRAVETARLLQVPATIEPRLGECDYGRWAGLTLDRLLAQEPDALAAWRTDPAADPHGGESLSVFTARVADWLETQLEVDGKTVAVTHGSVIRAALVHAIGAPVSAFWRIDIAPLSVTRLSGSRGHWTLTFANLQPARDPVPES